MRGRTSQWAWQLSALAGALLVAVPLVAGFFSTLHPAFDSFAHFRAHLAVLLVVAGLGLMATRLRWNGAAALLLGAAAFTTTFGEPPWRAQASSVASDTEALARYRLLHLNMRYDNPTPERVLSLIARERPDVMTLVEISPRLREKLDLVAAAYPYRIVCRRPAVAILSRRPFIDDSARCAERGRLVIATVDFGGQHVDVAAAHLAWPWPRGQYRQAAAMMPDLAGLKPAGILAGDFNAAPWSALVRRIAGEASFTTVSRVGPTWAPRWVDATLRGLVGLPIDHVLTKERIIVHGSMTVEDAGSDHAPVRMDFSIVPEREPSHTVVLASSLR